MKKIPKRIWIRIAKIAGIVIGLYLLSMTAISLYISSSEERLVKTITGKAEQSILGKLLIKQAGISVWHSFPKLSLTLNNVTIADSVSKAPVLEAKSIYIKVGLFDLVSRKVKVSSIKVTDATVHILTRKDGFENDYIFKSRDKQKKKNKKPFVVSNLVFENVTLISENQIKNKRYEVRFKSLDADMSLTAGVYHIQLKENALIRGLGFNMAKGYWLENQTVSAKWNMKFDTAKKQLSIDKTDVQISNQPFEIGATFYLLPGNDAHFRLDAQTKQIPYRKALAILKPTTRAKINKIDLKKPLDVNITLDGPLAYKTTPLVHASWQTKMNTLTSPAVNLDSVTFNGTFTNHFNDSLPFGDENSNVHFNLFTAKWGGITLTAKEVALTNLRVPELQFDFYSSTTLAQLNEALNSNDLNFINGAARLYISFKGPLAADVALLNRLNAQIQLTNGEVLYVPTNMTFTDCNGIITFYNNNLYIKNLKCNLNKSSITVNVKGNNINKLSDDEAGKAIILCNVASTVIDLNDLKKIFNSGQHTAKRKAVKAASDNAPPSILQIDNVLENGTIQVDMKLDEVLNKRFKASEVITSISFRENDWQIHKIYGQFAGGTLNMTGVVNRTGSTTHNANVNLDVKNMNISQVFYGFDNFGMTSLTSNNIKGVLNMKSNLIFNINNDGNMLPGSLNGYLDLSVKKGALIKFEPIKSIQKFALKNRDLDNIEFEELKDKLEMQNGNVYINRMPIQSNAFIIYVEGVYSLKDQTNIGIQVPIKTIFSKPDYDKKALSTDKGGASIWLRAKTDNDGKVKVGLDVFKKLRNDKYEDVIADSTAERKSNN